MSTDNLRIIYNNVVDLSTTTILASSTAGSTSVDNLKIDSKSKIWRSSYKRANLIVTLSEPKTIGGIVLPFCNLSPTATIRVMGYANTVTLTHDNTTPSAPTITVGGTGTTPIITTGWITAAPYQVLDLWNWGTVPLGVNTYSYGGGTYARVYVPTAQQTAVSKISIEIIDDSNTAAYLEASRLVMGAYWSPKYNTSFGLSFAVKDLSSHSRTEAGDLNTIRGVRYNSLNFDLKYMDANDRSRFLEIVRGNGLPRPLFISLFPEDADHDKEQQHQVYGKLAQLSPIQHPIFEMYSTQIEIEEI